MADISSITLPGGGTYDLKDKNAVPKYGMGKNLLDNWYFLNPVNQRGKTALNSNGYFIDRWLVSNSSNYGTVSLVSDGLSITHSQNTGYTQIYQVINNLSGKECTLSGIVDGALQSCTLIFSNQRNSIAFGRLLVYSINNLIIMHCPASTSDVIIKALKLELGTEQTLAHQENGVWVLNEVPDYEEELIKCQTSTADGSDTYANKSLATEQQLAYVETGTTASRAYAVGECFCWNGLLYKATTTISTGQAFTPGANCRQTTVCDKQGYRLLWTNSNPNASFSAATLANTGGFRRYHIVFRVTSSSANYFDFVGLLDVGVYHAVTNITSPMSGVPVLSFRTVVKEASGNLTISNCDSRQVTATSRSQDNASIIPYQVFAIL